VILNATLQTGVTYVPAFNAFRGHEECTADSWLYPIGQSPLVYGAQPLAPGQQALARIVRGAIG